MNWKIYLWMVVLIISSGFNQMMAQSLIVMTKDGAEEVKSLSAIQNFTFLNNNLVLGMSDKITEEIGLSTIQKIYFKDVPQGIENKLVGAQKYIIYPNPVNDVIYLKYLPDIDLTINIYRIYGVKMMQKELPSGNNSIDVNHLSSGIYILMINNQAIKFQKL
jgi:hypothetical protein